MDSKFQLLELTGNPVALNAFQMQSKAQTKYILCKDAKLAAPNLKNTQGIKRKWIDAWGSEELDVEDGFSPRQSSSPSDSSRTNDESSVDMELDFHLNLGSNDALPNPNNAVLDVGKLVEPEKQNDPKQSLPASSSSSTSTIISASPFYPYLLQVASVDSAEMKPVLSSAPTSSSTTNISDFSSTLQHDWITYAEHLQEDEKGVRNVSCHDDYWTSKRLLDGQGEHEKSDLCARHRAHLQDRRVHGGRTGITKSHFPTIVGENYDEHNLVKSIRPNFQSGQNSPNVLETFPMHHVTGATEGRVHGGSLMSVVRNSTESGGNNNGNNHTFTTPSTLGF